MSSDYLFNQIPVASGLLTPKFLIFSIVGVLAFALAWRSRKVHPFVLMSIVGYMILFSLTSNLVFLIGVPMAERWAYMPSIFLCGLTG